MQGKIFISGQFLFLSLVCLFMFFSSKNVDAQDVQLWLEADVHKNLGESWKFKTSPNFRKYYGNTAWHRYGVKNSFSQKFYPWFTGEGSLDFFYTVDRGSDDIGEIRAGLATKFIYPEYIAVIHLDKPYIYFKLEERFLFYREKDKDDQKSRLRIKVGGTFILNGEKVTIGTFYIPWYAEDFHNFDGEAFEHYASRGRVSVGLGYVFNKKWRGEFDYIIQGSRNTLEDGYVRSDNIFQLKADYFLD